jgi:hypothetical protein
VIVPVRKRDDLTVERIRELFDFDPESGTFVRRVRVANQKAGTRIKGAPLRTGYLVIRVDGAAYVAHRLAWLHHYGEWPKEGSDLRHVDGNRSNNAIANLEIKTVAGPYVPKGPYEPFKGLEGLSDAERLRALFLYDPHDGSFTRKRTTAPNACAGDVAGTAMTNGYVGLHFNGGLKYAHRLAWLYMMDEWPPKGYEIDHRNRVKNDNRWKNLRLATRSQNSANKAGVKGFRKTRSGKWHASIQVQCRTINLGVFENHQAAKAARLAAEEKYFGEFSGRRA